MRRLQFHARPAHRGEQFAVPVVMILVRVETNLARRRDVCGEVINEKRRARIETVRAARDLVDRPVWLRRLRLVRIRRPREMREDRKSRNNPSTCMSFVLLKRKSGNFPRSARTSKVIGSFSVKIPCHAAMN